MLTLSFDILIKPRVHVALCTSALLLVLGAATVSADTAGVDCASPNIPNYTKRMAGCGGATSTAAPSIASSPTPVVAPSSNADPTDPKGFDLSGLPPSPTNFEEQLIADSLRDPHLLDNAPLLAQAHRQLGRYYAARGRADLAGTEYAKALVADPTDYRSYAGLARISDAVGAPAGDGTLDLHDAAQLLADDSQNTPTQSDEPEPAMTQPADNAQWQSTSAEFNRRMNSLYTSNAWSNVYRTVFTNLYGH